VFFIVSDCVILSSNIDFSSLLNPFGKSVGKFLLISCINWEDSSLVSEDSNKNLGGEAFGLDVSCDQFNLFVLYLDSISDGTSLASTVTCVLYSPFNLLFVLYVIT
jgi:hypothetical protein